VLDPLYPIIKKCKKNLNQIKHVRFISHDKIGHANGEWVRKVGRKTDVRDAWWQDAIMERAIVTESKFNMSERRGAVFLEAIIDQSRLGIPDE